MLDSGTQYLSEGRAGYSALEILDIDLEALPEDELEEYRAIFEDRIVLVGDTWEVTHDKFNTPVGQVYGVEIIADTINTIMNDAPLRPSGWFLEISSMAIFLSVLLATSLIPTMTLRLLAVVGAYVTYIVIAGSLYVYAGSVLSMSYAILTGFLVVIFTSIRLYMVTEEKEKLSTADSVESNRMLGMAYQGQGQLDSAFEKFRVLPPESQTFELLYNLGLDYERKRQFNKAALAYEEIAEHDSEFRDVERRLTRARSMEDAVLMGGTTQGMLGTVINDDGSVEKPMLGRYQIEKELGQGAMGVVYLGTDPKINREVAIKTMALSSEFDSDELVAVKERFFREAESAGRLSHPNIVGIFDAGEESDLAYIAMELLKGGDLDDYTRPDNLLPLNTVLEIGVACAEALDYAHEQQVVHRDIKPSNIMYDPESGAIKITDFGIARITDSSKTKTGTVLGTPNYMSPEQCMGKKVDGRADLFSLGVVMYQLASGDLPFKGDSMATLMFAIVNHKPVDIKTVREDIPPTLRKVIHNSIGKKPEKRYQSGAKMAEHLRVCIERLNDDASNVSQA
ncbi:MAG: protein kinase [Pseudomonadota bacterium]